MSTTTKASGATPFRLQLSRVGLGCTTFGREIDQAASFAMMDYARANGINHFDTASAYANGASEQIIGAWLASRRPDPDSILVATKLGAPFTPERIEDSIRQSLERLGVEALDLWYFHQWSGAAADPAVLAVLDRAVQCGKIRALGASNFSANQLERVLQTQRDRGYAPMRALQNNHNYAVRDVDERLKQLCVKQGVAIVTYSPLGAGFLTGKHKRNVEKGSRFDIVPAHQPIYFHEASWRRLDQLEEAATQTGHSIVTLALAWALHQPGITSVLVGGRQPAQLENALTALSLDDAAVWRHLDTDPST